MLNIRKKSKGFTLIEILLVVGFIALASIGVYVVYNKVQTGNAANTEARNVDVLRAGIKNLYGGTISYANINSTVLLNGRVVPDNMRDASGTNIVNSFGGIVTVNNSTYGGGGTNNSFDIVYPNVPADVCSKFVTIAANSFNRVYVISTKVKDTAAGQSLNIAGLTSACNMSGGSGVTVTFTSI